MCREGKEESWDRRSTTTPRLTTLEDGVEVLVLLQTDVLTFLVDGELCLQIHDVRLRDTDASGWSPRIDVHPTGADVSNIQVATLNEHEALRHVLFGRWEREAIEHFKAMGAEIICGPTVSAPATVPEFRVKSIDFTHFDPWNDSPDITDDDLRKLTSCSALEFFATFTAGQLTDDGLACFQNHPELAILVLHHTKFGGAGLQHLVSCSKLTELDLYSCELRDNQVEGIGTLKSLQVLNVYGDRLTDEGLRVLKDIPDLQSLSVGVSVNGSFLKDLPANHSLETLEAAGSRFSNQPLEELRKFSHLRRLDLEGCDVSDEGCKHLACLRSLYALNLRGTHVGNLTLEALRDLDKLDYLNVCNTRVTADGIRALQENLPRLEVIHSLQE